MRMGALIALLLLLPVGPAQSQVPDERLVVPGARIGRASLEMTIPDLVRILGLGLCVTPPPDPIFARTFAICLWLNNPFSVLTTDRISIDALSVSEGGSSALATLARTFRTDKGIGIGSTRSEVASAYGSPTGGVRHLVIYDESGITFGFERDQVSILLVFRPRTAATIWRFQPVAPTTPLPSPTPSPDRN